MVSSIEVVGALTRSPSLYSVCDLKAAQINVPHYGVSRQGCVAVCYLIPFQDYFILTPLLF